MGTVGNNTWWRRLAGLTSLGVAAALLGCGPALKEWEPEKKSAVVYSVAFRQLPPEPVYNRLRWVHLPSPLPDQEPPSVTGPMLMPVFYMQLKNATLEQASRALAQAASYNSFCVSSIATHRVTINTLGTLDELAEQIAARAAVYVSLDHQNREIRFLTSETQLSAPATPRFLDSTSTEPQASLALEVEGK